MNAQALREALDLPAGSRVHRRVPKKLLLEHGAPTAADKRRINAAVEEFTWAAALKPTTIGVTAYRDATREYLEIAVLHLVLRAPDTTLRLTELVHRAIPYPVLLIAEHGERTALSAAHKRWSQGEAGKTVLEGEVVVLIWEAARESCGSKRWKTETEALALGRQPRDTLYALYQGWIDALLALKAARITGAYTPARDAAHAEARETALREYARLESEASRLRAAAEKEKQMPRRVALNLELQRVEAARAATRAKL